MSGSVKGSDIDLTLPAKKPDIGVAETDADTTTLLTILTILKIRCGQFAFHDFADHAVRLPSAGQAWPISKERGFAVGSVARRTILNLQIWRKRPLRN